jgi:hypothetical protein
MAFQQHAAIISLANAQAWGSIVVGRAFSLVFIPRGLDALEEL